MELGEDRLSPPEDRNMNRKTITTFCAIPSALFLVLIGIVHSMVNFSGLRRALARGEIVARLGDPVLFNAGFSGLLISLLGLIVFLFLPGLRPGGRQASPVAGAFRVFL